MSLSVRDKRLQAMLWAWPSVILSICHLCGCRLWWRDWLQMVNKWPSGQDGFWCDFLGQQITTYGDLVYNWSRIHLCNSCWSGDLVVTQSVLRNWISCQRGIYPLPWQPICTCCDQEPRTPWSYEALGPASLLVKGCCQKWTNRCQVHPYQVHACRYHD